MYFQLEPNAFLADIDFQAMSAQERGVYFTLILYLYANGGTVGVAKGTLYSLCNYGCDMLEWEQMWDNIKHKFTLNGNGEITHKRVSREIAAAEYRMQVAVESGLKGADKRWGADRVPIADKDRVPIAKKRKEKVSKEKNTPPTPRGVYSQEFLVFWGAYPKKRSKGQAWKSWQKIKPSKALRAEFLVAIEQQKKWEPWLKDGGQFIPYPSSWLNGGCWDDEVVEGSIKKTTAEKLAEYNKLVASYE